MFMMRYPNIVNYRLIDVDNLKCIGSWHLLKYLAISNNNQTLKNVINSGIKLIPVQKLTTLDNTNFTNKQNSVYNPKLFYQDHYYDSWSFNQGSRKTFDGINTYLKVYGNLYSKNDKTFDVYQESNISNEQFNLLNRKINILSKVLLEAVILPKVCRNNSVHYSYFERFQNLPKFWKIKGFDEFEYFSIIDFNKFDDVKNSNITSYFISLGKSVGVSVSKSKTDKETFVFYDTCKSNRVDLGVIFYKDKESYGKLRLGLDPNIKLTKPVKI